MIIAYREHSLFHVSPVVYVGVLSTLSYYLSHKNNKYNYFSINYDTIIITLFFCQTGYNAFFY